MKRYYINVAVFSAVCCICLTMIQPTYSEEPLKLPQKISDEIESQASDLYEKAVELIKDEDYKKAKEIFLELKDIYPNYKSSQKYLDLVEEQLSEEQSYAQRLAELEKEKIKQQEQEALLRTQVDPLYAAAIKLYKKEDFEKSQKKFEEVENIYSGYKETSFYLNRIVNDIEMKRLKDLEDLRIAEKKALEKRLKKTYAEGVSLYRRKKYDFAKLRFEDIQSIDPEYKSVEKYLATIDDKIIEEEARVKRELKEAFESQLEKEEQEKRDALERERKEKAENLYQEALGLFKQDQYELAQKKFDELNEVMLNYKSANKYISKTEQALADIKLKQDEEEKLAFQREVEEEQKKIMWEDEKRRKLKELEDRALVVDALVEEEKLIAQGLPVDRTGLEEDKVLSPSALKAKEGYIVDLKELINKSRKKISQVNEKLEDQARRRRNQQREERARVYYEKAMRLFDDGKFDEARILWEKAVRITEHEEMKDYVRDSVKRSKRQEKGLKKEQDNQLKRLEIERGYSAKEVERKYQSGVSLFKQNKYLAARDDFEEVEDMFPDHKATRSYLMLIEQNILRDQEALIREKIKEKAQNRQKEKELWRKKIEKQERSREEELEAQADEIYRVALRYYKERDWVKAKEKFKEVEWILPDYKKTIKYLKRVSRYVDDQEKEAIDPDTFKDHVKLQKKEDEGEKEFLEQQNKLKAKEKAARIKEEADFVYGAAVALYKQRQYEEALVKFKEVLAIDSKYKKAYKYIDKLKGNEEKLQKEKEEYESRKLKKKKLKEAHSYYKDAVAAFKARKYLKAQKAFQLVENVYPDYRSTAKYLAMIKTKLEDQNEELDYLYLSGVSLYKAKQFDKAEEKFKEVLAIDENHVNANKYLQGIDKKQAKQQQSEVLEEEKRVKKESYVKAKKYYDAGMKAYKKGAYPKAREAFLRAEKIYPGYKNALRYLTIIETRMEQAKKEPSSDELKSFQGEIKKEKLKQKEKVSEEIYRRAMSFYKKEDYAAAKGEFLNLQNINLNYKNTKKYLSIIDDRLDDQEKNEQVLTKEIDRKYKKAVTLYKRKKFHLAQKQFLEVEELSSSYRSTDKYLKKIQKILDAALRKEVANVKDPVKTVLLSDETKIIDRAVAQRQKELQIKSEVLYTKAVDYYTDKNFIQAKQSFIELESFDPGYKETLDYLSRIDDDITRFGAKAERQRRSAGRKVSISKKQASVDDGFKRDIEELYFQAVNLYKAKEYDDAKDKFQEVNRLMSDFENTNSYIKKINKKLKKKQSLKEVRKKENEKLKSQAAALAVKDVESKPEVTAESRAEIEKKRIKKEAKRVAALKSEEELISVDDKKAYAQYTKDREAIERAEEKARKERLKRDKLLKKERIQSKKEQERNRKRAMRDAKKLRRIRQKEYRDKDHAEMRAEQAEPLVSPGTVKSANVGVLPVVNESVSEEVKVEEDVKPEEGVEASVVTEVPMTRRELRVAEKKRRKALKKKQKIARKNEERLKRQYEKNQKEIAEKVEQNKQEEEDLWDHQMGALYKKAVKLFDEQQYKEAKEKFGSIRALHPKYGSVGIYWDKLIEMEEVEPLVDVKQPNVLDKAKNNIKNLIDKDDEKEKDKDKEKKKVSDKEKDNKKAEKIDLVETENDKKEALAKVFDEACSLLRRKKLEKAQEKFDDFEVMLNESDVDERFILKLRKKYEKKLVLLEKAFKDEDKVARKREEEKKKRNAFNESKKNKQKELDELEKEIEHKEALIQEKLKASQSMSSVAKRTPAPKVVDVKKTSKGMGSYGGAELEMMTVEERARREKLRKMITARKNELELERIEIVKAFDENLESIYDKAVQTYGSGKFIDAKRLFLEIDTLSPGYEKTVYYLNKINKKLTKIESSQKKKKPFLTQLKDVLGGGEDDRAPLMSSKSRQSIISNTLDSLEY